MFLVNVCSYLGAKDLRGVLGNNCREKRLRLRQVGGKQPFGARAVKDNPFILVNNIVLDCRTIAMNAISHCKWKCRLLFVDARCIFLSMDENAY